jgi:coiled-coil domain-containing protein 130
VRFNAGKKEVGRYLSTKIYEFSMKCHMCAHPLKVRTDPKHCDYILFEGLQKIRPEAQVFTQKKEANAFERVEEIKKDVELGLAEMPRLQALIDLQSEKKTDF